MGAAHILLVVSVILLAACLRNALAADQKLTPERKTWILTAVILAGVSALLQVLAASRR
jgi:hypothetical protein